MRRRWEFFCISQHDAAVKMTHEKALLVRNGLPETGWRTYRKNNICIAATAVVST